MPKLTRGTKKLKNTNNYSTLTYIVAHKEIIGIGRIPSYPKQLDEIVELTVDITAYRHRALHRLYVPFLHQNRPRLIAERLDLRLRQRLALHQMLDLTVQIRVRGHRSSLSLSRPAQIADFTDRKPLDEPGSADL